MAVPQTKQPQRLINTTGTAIIATVRNDFRGKVISKETPIAMNVGTIVEQVGNPVDFMGVIYFYDTKGDLYNAKDFIYYLPEVNLVSQPTQNQITPSNSNIKNEGNGNMFWWIIGGVVLYSMFKK